MGRGNVGGEAVVEGWDTVNGNLTTKNDQYDSHMELLRHLLVRAMSTKLYDLFVVSLYTKILMLQTTFYAATH
jgi:hypothetical protein